jgi:hypothetical protein
VKSTATPEISTQNDRHPWDLLRFYHQTNSHFTYKFQLNEPDGLLHPGRMGMAARWAMETARLVGFGRALGIQIWGPSGNWGGQYPKNLSLDHSGIH